MTITDVDEATRTEINEALVPAVVRELGPDDPVLCVTFRASTGLRCPTLARYLTDWICSECHKVGIGRACCRPCLAQVIAGCVRHHGCPVTPQGTCVYTGHQKLKRWWRR